MADTVLIWAEHNDYGSGSATQFEDVKFLKVDDHVWARGGHHLVAENPDTVNEGDAFLFDSAAPPEVMVV